MAYELEESLFGVWIVFANGRRRFALRGSELYAQLMSGRDLLQRERGRDSTVYYRNPDGSIGVPPTADTPIPADAVRCEATTLAEQDSLARELAAEHRRKWEGSAEATAAMEQGLEVRGQSPRQFLIDKMARGDYHSQLEHDVIPLMVADLDREERDRERITSNCYIHSREFDRRR